MATTLPAFIKQDLKLPAEYSGTSNLGNEMVGAEDLSLPRFKLLQALSPELNEDSDSFVEGAKQGMFCNSVTGSVYKEAYVVNVYYEHYYACFKKRLHGGGYVGKFSSPIEAKNFLADNALKIDDYDVVETGRHFLLVLNDKGEIAEQVVYDMTSTSYSVSQEWNTKINGTKAARFASVWKLESKKRANAKGSWFIPSLSMAGYVPKELFEQAKTVYEGLASAVK